MEPTTDAKDPAAPSPAVVPDATVVSSATPTEGAKPDDQSWDSFEPTVTLPAPPAAKTEEPVASPAQPVKEVVTPPAPAIEGKKEGEPTPSDDSKLPFHQHPRWQEVIKERDSLKQATEALKPFIDQQKNLDSYLRTNRITPDQFSEALQFLALQNSNPAEAYNKYVKPLNERLGKYEGQVIPPDLQEKVDRGVLTAEDAAAWSKQRANAEFTQQRLQQDAVSQEEQAQATALDDWVSQKRKSDPDYEVKREEIEDRHLKLVSLEWQKQGIGQPGRPTRLSASALTQLADQAYADINGRYTKRTPPPKLTTTHLSPTSSPSVSKAIPANWDDAVEDLITSYAGT